MKRGSCWRVLRNIASALTREGISAGAGLVEIIPPKKISNFLAEHMGVSIYRGTPKWMVYNGKSY